MINERLLTLDEWIAEKMRNEDLNESEQFQDLNEEYEKYVKTYYAQENNNS